MLCQRGDCKAEAAWTPKLHLVDAEGNAAIISTKLELCGPHAYMLEVADLLPDIEWEGVCVDAFDKAGRPRPERKRTRLVITRL